MLNSIAYSQDTRTKVVKVSTLKAMGKELEKCNLLQEAYEQKSANFDSITNIYINLFSEMKRLQTEKKLLDTKLDNANAELLKATKRKKSNGIFYAMGGTIVGIIAGNLILN